MTLYMETTRIAAERTVSEIQQLLSKYGAKAILMEYEGCQVSAVSFQYVVEGQTLPFRLPCRWKNMESALRQGGKRPRYDDTYETWARRVAWRQILRWTEAQLALVETSMVKIQEVFFPYMVVKGGSTIYEIQEQKNFGLLLGAGKSNDH